MLAGDSLTRYQYLNLVYFLEYGERPPERDRESICWYAIKLYHLRYIYNISLERASGSTLYHLREHLAVRYIT